MRAIQSFMTAGRRPRWPRLLCQHLWVVRRANLGLSRKFSQLLLDNLKASRAARRLSAASQLGQAWQQHSCAERRPRPVEEGTGAASRLLFMPVWSTCGLGVFEIAVLFSGNSVAIKLTTSEEGRGRHASVSRTCMPCSSLGLVGREPSAWRRPSSATDSMIAR